MTRPLFWLEENGFGFGGVDPSKIEVSWVLGVYIYMYIYIHIFELCLFTMTVIKMMITLTLPCHLLNTRYTLWFTVALGGSGSLRGRGVVLGLRHRVSIFALATWWSVDVPILEEKGRSGFH